MIWVFTITTGLLFVFFAGVAIVVGCATEYEVGFKRRLLTTMCVIFSLTAMITAGSCLYHAPGGENGTTKTLGGTVNKALINGAKKTKLKDGRCVWDEFN